MKTQHTPGPWNYSLKPLAINPFSKVLEYETKENYYAVKAGLGYFSAKSKESTGFEAVTYMSEADARLMATAPELLESLEWLIKQIPELQGEISLIGMQKCYEAIAKAKGV